MTSQWKTQNGEEKSETTWIRVICWNNLAENVSKIFNVGDLVQIDGSLTSRVRVKDDFKYTITEVVADKALLMCPISHRKTEKE